MNVVTWTAAGKLRQLAIAQQVRGLEDNLVFDICSVLALVQSRELAAGP